MDIFNRLISRVEVIDDCWIWQGYVTSDGYGLIGVNGKLKSTHRAMAECLLKVELGDMQICHICDNPSCINPSHLLIGDRAYNMNDMAMKGRSASGERHGMHKLTQEDIVQIRGEYTRPDHPSQRALGRRFGVSQTMICYIVNNMLWNRSV